ncbi:biopolymer transporter ExbD [Roseibium sp.]|uniref:ExbD/TolR family protein n=1 Tax=Roseibium sp. TaxID=1936156 RepID=UPI002620479E|nr:biopolymer transporter ExbD [Roseibium sp.]
MQVKPRVKRRPVGLTSLIDVIFLLLLFFMLASSFTRYQSLDVSSGGQGGGADFKPAYLRIHTSEKIDLNGMPLTKPDMAGKFAELTDKDNMVVAIWSGPEASVQDVVDVMSAARQSGLKTVLVTGK